MNPRELLSPELVEPLDQFMEATDGRGLAGIADPVARRAAFDEMMSAGDAAPLAGVEAEDVTAPGPDGGPGVRLRIYRPEGVEGELPLLYYIHGGGMEIGSIETEDAIARRLTAEVQCVTASVEYRLAPEHLILRPSKTRFAGLTWVAGNAESLSVDSSRMAVYGGSAGGALAASTALLARDRNGPRLAFQMLLYPMIDDRVDSPSACEIEDIGVWDGWANRVGWKSLLGERRGVDDGDYSAVPARCKDLAGLPPTWIDVGQIDALRDESIEYAARLMRAGVPTSLRVYPGAFHGWEVFAPAAEISKQVIADRVAALRAALH